MEERCEDAIRFFAFQAEAKKRREKETFGTRVQSNHVINRSSVGQPSPHLLFSLSSESLFPLLAFLDSLEAHDRIFASEKKSQTYLEATRDQLSRVRFHPRSSEENLRQRRSRDK